MVGGEVVRVVLDEGGELGDGDDRDQAGTDRRASDPVIRM